MERAVVYGQEVGKDLNEISQPGEDFWGLLVAVHPGEELFMEAGVGYSPWFNGGHGPFMMGGYTLSVEVKPGEDLIVAPRLTAWLTFIGALAIGAGYYTDFEGGTFVIQPEVGLGFAGGRITWRINLPLGKELEGMNGSELNVSAFIPIL